MKSISSKIGFWSALAMLSTFVIWIVSFVGISFTSDLFIWTDLSAYLDYYRSNSQFFQNLAKAAMLVFAPAFVIVVNVLHEVVPSNKKQLSRLGLLFALAFAILSSIHYFVQLSSVRVNIERGITNGIENFAQANPLSVMTSIDMLGWTLFLGLASVFMYFSVRGMLKWAGIGFLVNGLSCLLAMVGYLLQIDVLTFTCINLGVGGAMLMVSISLMNYFLKKAE